ncbi:hypothetical protein MKX34_11670 [Paenibacillus sp. FSL R5-0636]|uniref:hypothetical protein n=1 Tax=Paenibacillus TaxID=44249 RepID=UPI00096C7AB5|nr:hypothetical protein [Paenibacillus odorifer]OMD04716.1 hypothetical protein BJP49_22875 [Paenibacillus odorifer]
MTQRDWQKDMEMAHTARYEHTIIHLNNVLDSLFYWLGAYGGLESAYEKQIAESGKYSKRADAAEARVKELENSARFELIRHIRTEADRKEYLLAEEIIRLEEREKQLKEESSEAIEGLYQIIQRGDLTSLDLDQAEEVYKRFRSTLYPDTPAPKEGSHEPSEIKRRD